MGRSRECVTLSLALVPTVSENRPVGISFTSMDSDCVAVLSVALLELQTNSFSLEAPLNFTVL